MIEQPTILFHGPGYSGLGHINRLSAIALALQQIYASVQTPFVVQGAGRLLLEALNLPCVPMSIGTHAGKNWAARMSGERSASLAEASLKILREIKPQIVVFDCFPNPEFVDAAVSSAIPIVLCVREMKDLDSYLHHVRGLLPHVRLILIPHEENSFELPEQIRSKTQFVGQIARPINRRFEPNVKLDQPRIVVTGGGGGFPHTVDFYNLVMKAISELLQEYPKLKSCLITGPLFRDWPLLKRTRGVAVVPFEADTLSSFAAADLVITQAGYNTVAELEEIGTKAILVPAERTWDDQFARADKLERLHANFRSFRGSEPIALARSASELLQDTTPPATGPRFQGALKAAEWLKDLLN